MPVIRDPGGRKKDRPGRDTGFRSVTIPVPKPAPVPKFKPPTPTQELGVAPVTTRAPNQAPYKPGRAPVQVTTTRINRQRQASPVPQNPADPRVVQIQQHLRALGYPIAVDGVMGPLTRTAMQISHNGTTPNFVHHPDHAKQQAADYTKRVSAELRSTSARGRAGVVKSQFVEPLPGEDPVIPRKPERFLPGGKRDKPIFYHPMFEGQKPAGTTGAFRGPDGTLYFPGQRAPRGSRVTTVPYYQAASAGEQPLQSVLGSTDHQDALRRFRFESQGGLGGAILAGTLHPAVDLLQAAAGERGITPGGALSDVAQIAAIGIPVAEPTARALGTLGDVMQAVRAEGITTNSLRAMRDLRAFSNQAALEASRAGRVQAAGRAVSKLPIVSPQRDELIQAFKDAPKVTPQQVKSATKFVDQIARNLAVSEGITPEQAYAHMVSAAKYHPGVDPTASEAHAISGSTTFQRADLTGFPESQDSWGDVWAKPEQLKAEMSSKRLGVPFVSKLHLLVADMPDRVGLQEILGKLKSAGIKQDEVKWNRFDEFLATATQKGQKSITRAEALAWLDKNYLKLEENRRFDSSSDAQYAHGYSAGVDSDATKFGSYTLPGGREANYQEFTIRLPVEPYGNLYEYTGHFPDPNIVAHARTTDRNIDGDPSLMIEEIQSDWHQAGQKQGYKMPVTEHPDYSMRKQAVEDAQRNVETLVSTTRQQIADSIINSPQFSNIPDNLREAFTRNVESRLGINLTDATSLRHFEDRVITAERARAIGARAQVETTGEYPHKLFRAEVKLGYRDVNLGGFNEHHYEAGVAQAQAMNAANSFNLLVDMPEESFKSVTDAVSTYRRALHDLHGKRDLMRALEHDAARGVHEAPFAKTWHELAFKRMLAEAVDKGYDRVGWTTGRTQAQRYQLGNFFRRLEIRAEGGGSEALEQWARAMAESAVEDYDAEMLGWDTWTEERLMREAESNMGGPPHEDDFTDPETEEFDQDAYNEAMDEHTAEVQAEFDDLKDTWLERSRESLLEAETDYFMENAGDYDGPGVNELTVYATDHHGQQHEQGASLDSYADNSLEDVVGPDVARAYREDGTSVFEGDNLVMGENAKSALGASHFYDNKLTGFVNKYLKKFGVSVEKKKIGSGKQTFDYRLDYLGGGDRPGDNRWGLEMPGGNRAEFSNYWEALAAQHDRMGNIPRATLTREAPAGDAYYNRRPDDVWVKWEDFPEGAQPTTVNGVPGHEGWGRDIWGPFNDETDARREVEDLLIRKMREWGQGQGAEGEEVHSIPITPDVRAFVEGGQPLFQKGVERRVKGAVDLGGRSGSVIHLFARADISTIVHEMGHVLHQYMPELGKLDQEKFARSFERYFAEGVAPDKRQQRLFDKMSAAMLRVYRHVENIPDANLTPEIRTRFNDFFTRETQRNPRIATMAASQSLHQLDDLSNPVDPMLTAAAMQVKNGGMEPSKAAEMFKQDEAAVRAEVDRLGSYEEKAYNNADVGAGPATTEEDARTILDRAQGTTLEPTPLEGLPGATRLEHTRPDGTKSYLTFPNRREAQDYLDKLPPSRDPKDHWLFQEETPPDDNLATPFDPLSDKTPREQVQGGLRGARVARGRQEAGYSDERAARARAADSAMMARNGFEGYVSAMRELKGELPKIDFQGFKELDTEALDALFTHIQRHERLTPYQKIRAQRSLLNAVEGRVPTKGELTLLENVFGKQTAKSLGDIPTLPAHIKNALMEVLNVPRSLMASFDLSAPFRQGLVVGTRHPSIFFRNFKTMFRTFGSEKMYQGVMDDVLARPTYGMMQRAKLAITDMGALEDREEQFYSNLAEKMTGGKYGPVRASGRAYTSFLVKTRADVFDHLLRVAQNQGIDVQNEKFLKSLGTYINSATGRGDLGRFQEAASVLNTVFFSPRLLASRVNFLNPAYYARLDPFARKEALRSALQLAGAAAVVLSLAKYGGAAVNGDPRNADFAKIKFGNTRLDILGGFQQPIRLVSQLGSGKIISSTTGDPLTLGPQGPGAVSRRDILLRFFEGKLAPTPSVVNDWFKGTDFQGQPFSWKKEAYSHMVPLLAQDSADLYKQGVGGMNGIEASLAGYGVGAFGIGIQTYGPKNPADKPTSKLQKEAKAAGFGEVPKSILIEVDHKANLDKISASNKGDAQARLQKSIEYYSTTTGRHDFDRLLDKKLPDSVAENLTSTIRDIMVGPGLSAYESAVKTAVEAKGIKVK